LYGKVSAFTLSQLAQQYIDSETRSSIRTAIRNHAAAVGMENFLNSVGADRRFFLDSNVLQEPRVLLTPTPRIPGTDGRKMSKSYNNFILLGESNESIRTKTRNMKTDPKRERRTDCGNPELCPVFDWHKLFSSPETIAWSNEGCRTAGIGCIECKGAMADSLIKWITPIRERRDRYARDPSEVLNILKDGEQNARKEARTTMLNVREAVFGWKKARSNFVSGSTSEKNAKVGD
jgi:tryptophanyl-tRNA synthetase